MKVRIVLLFLAIIFGIAAVIGVMIYLNNIRSSMEKESELVSVLVASQEISKETKVSDILKSNSVETKEIPKKYLVEGALNSLDSYTDYIAKVDIGKGEQLTPDKFGKIEDLRISFTVPDGFIAISIPYDIVRGVSNLINPGDKVNVIATFTPAEDDLVLFNKDIVTQSLLNINESAAGSTGAAETTSSEPSSSWFLTDEVMDESNYIVFPQTKILLWNVEVLYIGSKIATDTGEEAESKSSTSKIKADAGEEISTLTLAVTPEQAEKLVFSEEMGKVWLTLLPADGIDEKETPGRTYLNIIEE
ncbi:MAG: hypothetical protein FJW66_02150 [Actinobacteria bacterium]|nr:hypothetical protein [Actinomycetota bacterium]